MQRSRFRSLVALNAVLLAALAVVTFAPSAQGQNAGRSRSQYTMLSGQIQGGSAFAIYIYDAGNLELAAVTYDISRQRLVPIGFRDINADSGRGPAKSR